MPISETYSSLIGMPLMFRKAALSADRCIERRCNTSVRDGVGQARHRRSVASTRLPPILALRSSFAAQIG
jgi:hypothetical protein